MTAFADYAMPVHYSKGIIHEHLHCRNHAGFFDISHMGQCRVLGDRAVGELEKLTPGGIADLACGAQKYTVLTNGDGGVIDDIIVTRIEFGVAIVVNAGCKEKDFAYLDRQLSGSCEFVTCPDLALFALQGPGAAAIMGKFSVDAARTTFMHACKTDIDGIICNVSRSGYSGEDGFEISLHRDDAERLAGILLGVEGVEPIGLGARDTLRMEAGLCLYGHELSETITPIEAGLHWLIKKGHGGFPGAERILAQLRGRPERLRVGLLVEGRIPVREGCAVYHQNDQVGYVTSGGFSPSLNRPIALAMLDRRFAEIGTALSAIVRDSPVAVTVCRLPFVPHSYHR
ncbi:MAG: glycine cleavage system aminomethyltransferase GcvT [Methylococcaceae bacterium]|nr:glycine cleavage system aminomethyltransferase GcvT [Methylococcaceae bacterium]